MEIYSEQFRVRFSETDRQGFMKLRPFFDYAQEVAGVHAEQLGAGGTQLRERHLAWVLSRMRLRISEYPTASQEFVLRTWPSGCDKLFALREYEFSRPDGTVFATATSCWLIVDTEKMHIQPAARILEGTPLAAHDPGIPRCFPTPDRLPPPPNELPLLQEIQVRESMLDGNQHVNNTEYAGMLQDAFGLGCRPWEFQINYLKEIPPESTVRLCGRHADDGAFQLAGMLGDTLAFEVAGTW